MKVNWPALFAPQHDSVPLDPITHAWLPPATTFIVPVSPVRRCGVVKTATFRVKGHLRDFPFFRAKSPQDGEFRIAASVDDGTFAFVPDQPQWPKSKS